MSHLEAHTAIHLANLFRTLSDPSRVRLISCLLDAELNVNALAQTLEMSESAVSHQLRGLRQMQLVKARRVGRNVFYSLDDEHVAGLFRQGLIHIEHK
jgi:DNA-binding transcriptional ArsR family regulator